MAMPGGMAGLLSQKYGILQQEADARTAAQQSQSMYQKGLVSAIPSEIEKAKAQTAQLNAQAQRSNAMLPIDTRTAEVASAYSAMPESIVRPGAQFRLSPDDMRAPNRITDPAAEAGWRDDYLIAAGQRKPLNYAPLGMPLGYAKGMARVPGRGDGTKDTVPAMLAPGEAVLNKSAADTAGRGLIAVLNELGARKMGMV